MAAAWLRSPALRAVVQAFGGPATTDARALAVWSATSLDTRGGRERQVVDPAAWDDATVGTLLDAASMLGLVATEPPTATAYDSTLVMGGTATANRLRAAMARAILDSGVAVGEVLALGAERPLMSWERERHPDVRHELESLDLGDAVDAAFPDRAVRLLVAPAGNGRARANTADAFDHLTATAPDRDVLVVTSAIYAPYTFFVAGAHVRGTVEVVGTPTSLDGDRAALAQRFAQETHSTLSAIAALKRGG